MMCSQTGSSTSGWAGPYHCVLWLSSNLPLSCHSSCVLALQAWVAMPSSWDCFSLLFCFVKEMHERIWQDGSVGRDTHEQAWWLEFNPWFRKWEERTGSQELPNWIIHFCSGMWAHTHTLPTFIMFLSDVCRLWKANVDDVHYCSSERTSCLESARSQRVSLSTIPGN